MYFLFNHLVKPLNLHFKSVVVPSQIYFDGKQCAKHLSFTKWFLTQLYFFLSAYFSE